jgi:putative PIN family toxin of toxin-antitoxin system
LRVFLDTNVLASAIATRGLCAELFEAVLAEHELIISQNLLTELDRILALKFGIPESVRTDFASLIAEMAIQMAAPGNVPEGIPDADDAPLIAAALSGGVACFITGDKALLALEQIAGMAMLSPRQFWERTRVPR